MALGRLPNHTVVAGPEALKAALVRLWEACQNSPEIAKQDHYLLYQRGNQQSVLKIELNKKPFQFWYCDRDGRPMMPLMKRELANFTWENGVSKEKYQHDYAQFMNVIDTIVHDISKLHQHELHKSFLDGSADRMENIPEDHSLPHAFDQVRLAAGAKPSIASSRFGLFQAPRAPVSPVSPDAAPTAPKPGRSRSDD